MDVCVCVGCEMGTLVAGWCHNVDNVSIAHYYTKQNNILTLQETFDIILKTKMLTRVLQCNNYVVRQYDDLRAERHST